VLTPGHILGQRIAERVAAELSPRRSDTVVLADDFAVVELTLSADQPHCGESIATVERETAVSVVGLWLDGAFVGDPDPETVVEEGTALLPAGREAALDAFEVDANRQQQQESAVVVVGHGTVGSTVIDKLGQWTPYTVVDTSNDDRVDVAGDATREETLRQAGVTDAATLVVTLGDDDQSILSVLSAGGVDPDIDITARVNGTASGTKIRRAGADYVLNLTDISGPILAQAVLYEDILSYNRQLRIVRTEATPYAGQ
jgi:Trk K+ transport system NAD-binding subunit